MRRKNTKEREEATMNHENKWENFKKRNIVATKNSYKPWTKESLAELKAYCLELFQMGAERKAVFEAAAKKFGRSFQSIASQWYVIEGAELQLTAPANSNLSFTSVGQAFDYLKIEFDELIQKNQSLADELEEYKEQNDHLIQKIKEMRENSISQEQYQSLKEQVVHLQRIKEQLEKDIKEWQNIADDFEKKNQQLMAENQQLHKDLKFISEALELSKKYAEQNKRKLELVK
jgi:chromosome segregation ATPase